MLILSTCISTNSQCSNICGVSELDLPLEIYTGDINIAVSIDVPK